MRTVVVRKALWLISALNVLLAAVLALERRFDIMLPVLIGGVAGLIYLELTDDGVGNGL